MRSLASGPARPASPALRGLLLAAALAGPAAAQDAPPLGSAPLSAQTAAKLFDAVCLSTAPSYAGAGAVLEAGGFAPNPETWTFYHPTLNLSFHVEDRCSMVFASGAPPAEIGLALAAAASAAGGDGVVDLDPATGATRAAGPAGTLLFFEPFTAPSGETYFRALLQPAR